MIRCVVFLLSVACACTTVEEPDAGLRAPDASVEEDGGSSDLGVFDAGPPTVEIGTGFTTFEPLTAGQIVVFTQGPQGGGRFEGYHLWGAVRTRGFDREMMRVAIRYLKASDRTSIAYQERILTLQPMMGAGIAYGFAPRIMDCCDVLGIEVVMRVAVVDRNGLTGQAEVTVMTPAQCLDVNSGQSVCP